MSQKITHTPLPWKIVQRRSEGTGKKIVSIVGANGETVLDAIWVEGTVLPDYKLIVDKVNVNPPKEGMSPVEKSIRRKLGKAMLAAVEGLDDTIYDRLNDREITWLNRCGFSTMSVFEMERIVAAGMKALYGIELKTLKEKPDGGTPD